MELEEYREFLEREVLKEYEIAKKARKKGFDPVDDVEIPIARNIGEKVERLVGALVPEIVGKGISRRINELEKEYGPGDWRISLILAEEVASNKFYEFNNKIKAMEAGIRVGMAYNTQAIVSAPLEGFLEIKEKKRRDGKKYIAVYYGGPIRAAGGTAAAFSVLLADYLRRKFGYEPYDPDEKEIKRYILEINSYHEKIARLQYYPTQKEIEYLVKHIPVEINGDPTTEREVIGFKDLDRVETNKIRGGMCLVLAEGVAQKAKKLYKNLSKWGKDFGLEDWVKFLEEYIDLQKKEHSGGEKKESGEIEPNFRYLEEVVAGRPILSHPLTKGGFRLRYGRTRFTGHDSVALNPATLYILDEFVAIGTQLRVERPGKGATITPCDSIEGPIVRLKDGSVVKVKDVETANKLRKEVDKILYLGDMLVPFETFLEHKHKLVPVGYCEEWWAKELERKGLKLEREKIFYWTPSFDEAYEISQKYDVPIHPEYTFFWDLINREDFIFLIHELKEAEISENKIILDSMSPAKYVLEILGIPHKVREEKAIIEGDYAKALYYSLGLNKHSLDEIENVMGEPIEVVNKLADFKIRKKGGTFIGARVGRPEKAKLRKMEGRPQMLFPVGNEGGRMRNLMEAYQKGYIFAEVSIFYCPKCEKYTIFPYCENCKTRTVQFRKCVVCGKYTRFKTHCGKETLPYERKKIDIKYYLNKAQNNLEIKNLPSLIKGVRGLTNEEKIPEPIEKGILRALHNVYVNKDGTIRIDLTELPITHFKPKEISVDVETLKKLGYEKDIYGKPLENEDQILEIFPQDIILPDNEGEENIANHLVNIAKFIDDLLVKFYGLEPFYNVKSKKDLIGKLVIGLAPHTSKGIVGRIIGFSKIRGLLAHPFFHSAMRRDCDGDEASVMLLLDGLINFSRKFLPNKRGSRTMDAPLILEAHLNIGEIDDEVYDLDVVWEYPLELYEIAERYGSTDEIDIETVKSRIKKGKNPYRNIGFTHPTSNINLGPTVTAYIKFSTMIEKVEKEMELAEKIRAVKEDDVAKIVIEKHFIRDIKGNLRKFSGQEFRCVKCNEKYRRIPLSGKCVKCGGNLVLTVSEGTVLKYLGPSLNLAKKYTLPKYIMQSLDLVKRYVESIFVKEKQEGLIKFFVK